MESDRTELQDLSGKEPGIVTSLAAKWDDWARRVGVQPWPVRRPKK